MSKLAGRFALITGGTSGIGFETARALAQLGAATTITGRDERRGVDAVARIRADAPGAEVRFEVHEASTLAGNHALAKRLAGQLERLDLLVNNVGGLYAKRWTTGDGHEATLAMNVLGPAALTESLAPLLLRSAAPRVVNLASSAHKMWRRDPFDDLASERSYVGMLAYGRAKLLNLLWTRALAAHWAATPVIVTAVNPGMAWTSMTEAMDPTLFPLWMRIAWPLLRRAQRRAPAASAATSTLVAAVGEAMPRASGLYLEKDGTVSTPSARARSVELADRTWVWLSESGAVSVHRARERRSAEV
jgi:NAD(P)-dependent dehydrogenase (short-subunit alcohol dehydrogenase family)